MNNKKNFSNIIAGNKLDSLVETLSYLYENELIDEKFLSNLNITSKSLILQESEHLKLINIKKSKKKTAPLLLDLKVFSKIKF